MQHKQRTNLKKKIRDESVNSILKKNIGAEKILISKQGIIRSQIANTTRPSSAYKCEESISWLQMRHVRPRL